MQLLSPDNQRTLKDRFKRELKRDVTIKLFTQAPSGLTVPGQDCPQCPRTQQLLEEVVSLSPKLHLDVYNFFLRTDEVKLNRVERIPALVLTGDGASNVKYYGIPSGYEFATLLEGLVTLSRRVSPLSLESRKKLKKLAQDVHVQVLVTPSSVDCPQVARLAHALAMENEHILADVVEMEEFPLIARRYQVRSVPTTVINELMQITGVVPEEELVRKVLEAGGVREPVV